MHTKKYTLAVLSIFGTFLLILFSNPVFWGLCASLDYTCRENYTNLEQVFWIFPVMLFFTSLTFLLKKDIFYKWWSFARISLPVLLILLFAVSFEIHHSAHGQWQDLFDRLFISILFGVFILGSTVQLVRGYFTTPK